MQLNNIPIGGDSKNFKVARDIDRERLDKIEKNISIIFFL